MLDDYDKLASLKDLAQREKWGGDFNAPTAAIPPRRFTELHIFQFVNFFQQLFVILHTMPKSSQIELEWSFAKTLEFRFLIFCSNVFEAVNNWFRKQNRTDKSYIKNNDTGLFHTEQEWNSFTLLPKKECEQKKRTQLLKFKIESY